MSVFCYAKAGGEAYISSGNVETVRAYGNVQLSSANIGNFYTYAGGRGHATTGTTTIRGLLALGEGSTRYSSYSFFYVYQQANLKVNGTTYINPRSKLRMNADSYTTFGGDIVMYVLMVRIEIMTAVICVPMINGTMQNIKPDATVLDRKLKKACVCSI